MYCFYNNIAGAPMKDWNRAAELLRLCCLCFTECSKLKAIRTDACSFILIRAFCLPLATGKSLLNQISLMAYTNLLLEGWSWPLGLCLSLRYYVDSSTSISWALLMAL